MTTLGAPPPQQQGPPPVPEPPSGPGVVPPFPAPPVEGRGRRVGLGLGLGALVLVLVLGGGLAAFIGLTTVATRALNEQADVVVSDYLDAVRDKRYGEAYDMLCQQTRDNETEAEFTSQVSAGEPIASFDVGDVELVQMSAPVDVTYADGSTARLRAYLAQNRRTGGFEVCRVEE
ncbi:hypothetical protein COUCH_31540 [Couchioplanes caeruleus]|uniref:Rv0361 family membrane protein n=1 Tax=Couchioplanes caeruleus TaxID=56438 RepID=UPI0020C11732|nr:hypothetical protein [Couchioplanes caeruleus]UQU63505.1 hypothetical protein COUCH_31540 [Couchioplanes caeruleus]